MRQRTSGPTERQHKFADNMASDFETDALHNAVYADLLEDFQLRLLCDAASAADDVRDRRENYYGEDAAFIEALEEAWGSLHHIARQRALEVVAAACKTVVREGEQWAEEDSWDAVEIQDAKQEAREWMDLHSNEMERVGELPDDSGETRIQLPFAGEAEYDIDVRGTSEIVVQWERTSDTEGEQ